MKRKPGNINLSTLRRMASKLKAGIKVEADPSGDPSWCRVSYPVDRRMLKGLLARTVKP